jgi:hypothetical protein
MAFSRQLKTSMSEKSGSLLPVTLTASGKSYRIKDDTQYVTILRFVRLGNNEVYC